MGLFLLLVLSCFFGWVFTEACNRRIEQLQVELAKEKRLRAAEKAEHEYIVQRLKCTIKELL
jgi:type II secretory pathway component PulM